MNERYNSPAARADARMMMGGFSGFPMQAYHPGGFDPRVPFGAPDPHLHPQGGRGGYGRFPPSQSFNERPSYSAYAPRSQVVSQSSMYSQGALTQHASLTQTTLTQGSQPMTGSLSQVHIFLPFVLFNCQTFI